MDYEMDCYPHGFCIIFNNSSGSKPRPGTGKDRCKLKELFKYLKYEVITEENKSADEMFNILTQINQDPKNQTFDSFVCCFLSHGDGNSIHGCDGKSSLPYTTIWSVFGKECSTLRNKPKIFIIQSCQTAATARLTIADQEMGTKKMDVDSNLTDSMETHDGEVPNIKFDQGLGTDHADILFIHASVPGSKAIRSNKGSPFVATFCKVVRDNYTTHSLMEMMQIVISSMKTRTDQLGDIKITVPSFSGSTCKKICFDYNRLRRDSTSSVIKEKNMISKHQMKIKKLAQKGRYNPKLSINPEISKRFIKNVLKDAVLVPRSKDPKDCYKDDVRNDVCRVMSINKQNGCVCSNRLRCCEAHVKTCEYRSIFCKRCEQSVVLFDHQDLQHDQYSEDLACPESTISQCRGEEEEEKTDLLNVNKHNYEDLKDNYLRLQDKCSKKDDLIKNVMIQNSQLKEEISVLKKTLDEMNKLKTVMNDMHLRFQ